MFHINLPFVNTLKLSPLLLKTICSGSHR